MRLASSSLEAVATKYGSKIHVAFGGPIGLPARSLCGAIVDRRVDATKHKITCNHCKVMTWRYNP